MMSLKELDGASVGEVIELMRVHGFDQIAWDPGSRREDDGFRLGEEKYAITASVGQAMKDREWKLEQERREAEEVVEKKLRQLFGKPNGLKHSSRRSHGLLRRPHKGKLPAISPLGIDHPSTWTMDGRIVAVTNDPYQLGLSQLRQIASTCKEFGLAAYVHHAAETYRPGVCLGIIFVRAGEESLVPSLERAIAVRRAGVVV